MQEKNYRLKDLLQLEPTGVPNHIPQIAKSTK